MQLVACFSNFHIAVPYKAKFQETHRALVAQYADSLETDPCKNKDMVLAAEIASGRIHSATTTYTLIRLLAEKERNIRQGRSRLNTSRLEGMTQEQMQDAGFHLAQQCRNTAGMASFGFNPKAKPTINFQQVGIPRCFLSINDPRAMQEGVRIILRHLKCQYMRCHVVLFDESNFQPGSCKNFRIS